MACGSGVSAIISVVVPVAAATAASPWRVFADSVHATSGGGVNLQDYAMSGYFAEDYVGELFLF